MGLRIGLAPKPEAEILIASSEKRDFFPFLTSAFGHAPLFLGTKRWPLEAHRMT